MSALSDLFKDKQHFTYRPGIDGPRPEPPGPDTGFSVVADFLPPTNFQPKPANHRAGSLALQGEGVQTENMGDRCAGTWVTVARLLV